MSPLRDQYVFQVAGFAKRACAKCHGTGRKGYESMETKRVQPCTCVVFFAHDDIVRIAEEGKKVDQRPQ